MGHKLKKKAKGLETSQGGFGVTSKQTVDSKTTTFEQALSQNEWKLAAAIWRNKNLEHKKQGNDRQNREHLKSLIYQGRDYMVKLDYVNASRCYCQALAIDPKNLDCLRNLALIDLGDERTEQALDLINEALEIRQDICSLWSVKVQCLGDLGRADEAQATLNSAFKLDLDRKSLMIDLVTRLLKKNPDSAVRIARLLLEENSDHIDNELFQLIGTIRQYACFNLEERIDWWSHADRLDASLIPNILLNLLPLAASNQEHKNLAKLQNRYKSWCHNICTENELPPLDRRIIKGSEPMRIGVVSGDFCNHVVARFLLPLLENLDPDLFLIHCFSTRPRVDDDTRRRFEAIALFVEVDPSDPRQLAQKVRQFNLDLCIDTAGFTAYGASQAFAWRMAPLQLSMIGYPGSTFIPNMDLLISDRILTPEMAWMHSEELMHLDGLAFCMEEPDSSIPVELEPPQVTHGFINFGVLINPYKYRTETIRLWADVLKSTPNSQLAIVRPECRSLEFQKNILTAFADNGIGKDRIIIVNNHGRKISYLDCYNKIDLVLDSAPMTGGTSTYEALLMGLPVVSLMGPGYHQRLSATMLYHAGLEDCIANSSHEFVAIASNLAKDVDRLRKLRLGACQLRATQGGLCDGKSYALRFEKALLKTMYQRNMLGDHWVRRMNSLMNA